MAVFVRFASFYAALFAVLGVYMQFFPVWLHDVGKLTHSEVTQAQSGQVLARTIAGPLWAQRVDRNGRPTATVVWLSLLSLLAFLCFFAARGLPMLFLCCALFGCVYPPLHPILDNLAMASGRAHGFRWPRVRLWGSLSFLCAIVAVGACIEGASSQLVAGLLVVLLAVSLAASLLLPRVVRPANTAARAPVGQLLRQGRFALFLVATGLLQGSHGGYYQLSTLYWRSQGIGEATAGLLWAEGVVAEIALFFLIRDAVERLRPTTLLLIGAAGAVVRWTLLSLTTDALWIASVNWLHAASFGCTYLGSLQFLRLRVADELQTTAQGLLGAATSGVGTVVGMLLAGEVYKRSPAGSFAAMAGLAAVGGLLALLLRRSRTTLRRDEAQRRNSASSTQASVSTAPPSAS